MAKSTGLYRASFSLPSDQAQLLNHIAKRMGCSQSAVIASLLELVLPRLADGLGADVTGDPAPMRYRGESAERIRDTVMAAMADALHVAQLDLL